MNPPGAPVILPLFETLPEKVEVERMVMPAPPETEIVPLLEMPPEKFEILRREIG